MVFTMVFAELINFVKSESGVKAAPLSLNFRIRPEIADRRARRSLTELSVEGITRDISNARPSLSESDPRKFKNHQNYSQYCLNVFLYEKFVYLAFSPPPLATK